MRIVEDLLPYCGRLQQRDLSQIELVVIHCTELPDLSMAKEYGQRIIYEQSGTGVSGHYYVDRTGEIYRFVPEDRIANHVIGHNPNSIGIELVNSGRYPNWFFVNSQIPNEPYPSIQITSLKELLLYLKGHLVNLNQIAQHSDLDQTEVAAEDNPEMMVRRKIDPGPQFPWNDLIHFWRSL
jgi:N-acetylmuramoyl-L-alanine amidase